MHSRRFACLLLGVWLGGSLLVGWAVYANARSADRLLERSTSLAALRIKDAGSAAAGLFRYQAAEQTRWLLEDWGVAQIALGGFLLLFILFATQERKQSLLLAAAMLGCAAVQRVAILPETAALGRTLDFTAVRALASENARLVAFDTSYLAVEAAKWGAGAWLLIRLLLRRRSRSADLRQQLNPIDKADYGHIDR